MFKVVKNQEYGLCAHLHSPLKRLDAVLANESQKHGTAPFDCLGCPKNKSITSCLAINNVLGEVELVNHAQRNGAAAGLAVIKLALNEVRLDTSLRSPGPVR